MRLNPRAGRCQERDERASGYDHAKHPGLGFFFVVVVHFILFIYFSFIFISLRLITLQYCSGFCHTLT